MSNTKKVNIIFLTLVLLVIDHVQSQEIIDTSNYLPACSDFTDPKGSTLDENSRKINIPVNRTNLIVYNPQANDTPFQFTLRENQALKCDENRSEERILSWNINYELQQYSLRFYSDLSGINEAHNHSYFTTAGYFYDDKTKSSYKPDGDYCVASHSNEDITLRVCVTGSDDCSNAATPNTWCLPKCCAVDEHLRFWTRKCVKSQNAYGENVGRTPWIPKIFVGPENPRKEMANVSSNLIFRMNQLPTNCNGRVVKGNVTETLVKWYSSAYSMHPINDTIQKNDNLRLAAPLGGKSGTIRPFYLHPPSRTWKLIENTKFCVDGFWIKSPEGKAYNGKHDHFVIYYCEENTEDTKCSDAISWIYVVISIISLLFLLATILVYVFLWEKQNLHGMTILSYTTATFFSFLSLLVAHFISLFPNEKLTGIFERGPFCYVNAVLAHYFFFASYLWLSVMNFDLWLTFKSVRAVRRDSKDWPKFVWYSLVAWLFPLILVIIFIVIDHVYRDEITEVSVPDYATGTCFVSEEFRGEYVYAPMAIMLGMNVVLISLTMKIFIDARRQTARKFSGSASNANQYSAKLFAKLFIIMGGTSIVDFITWYYNNKGCKHVIVAIIEGITYLTPVALFALFCLNNRVVNQLREKYPAFMESVEPVLRCIKKSEDTQHTVSTGDHSSSSNKGQSETQFSSLERSERIPLHKTSNGHHSVPSSPTVASVELRISIHSTAARLKP